MKLIVGLGNPGPEYERTRHNAGAWFAEMLSEQSGQSLRLEVKFQGLYARMKLAHNDCHVLIPTTFMNHSGQSVAAVARFYKIEPENILVAHDELDLPTGSLRLKKGGGHAGHNGLRDIIAHLGTADFLRLRIGIGHPGHSSKVLNYVLGLPSKAEAQAIQDALISASAILPTLFRGNLAEAMQTLHSN